MRITIPIPSRNRPAGLLASLHTLDALASGAHEITYVVLIDSDDEITCNATNDWRRLDLLPQRTHVIIGERDKTVNARVNEAIGAFSADIYCQMSDDAFSLTQHWDQLFMGLHSQGVPCWAWQEVADPGNATYIAISEKWRSTTGHMYVDHFPFWFADTWLLEVHLLAFARGIAIVNQLILGGKRGKTQGMRDLEFWMRFYDATTVLRIEEAEKLAIAYGFTLNVERDRKEQLDAIRQGHANQLSKCSRWAVTFGEDNTTEPSERYKATKAKAEAWLKEHDRRILVPKTHIETLQ